MHRLTGVIVASLLVMTAGCDDASSAQAPARSAESASEHGVWVLACALTGSETGLLAIEFQAEGRLRAFHDGFSGSPPTRSRSTETGTYELTDSELLIRLPRLEYDQRVAVAQPLKEVLLWTPGKFDAPAYVRVGSTFEDVVAFLGEGGKEGDVFDAFDKTEHQMEGSSISASRPSK